MLNSKVWDPPAVREAQQFLAAGAAGDTVIAEASGRWSACDVYIQANQRDYLGQEFYIRSKSGNVIAELGAKLFDDLNFPYQPGGVGVGRVSGILFSVRGRPSDGFIFGAKPSANDRPEAFYRMRCWAEDGFYGDRSENPPLNPFCDRSQTLQTTIGPLVAGAQVLFPAHPDGRRNYITRIVISNAAAGASYGPITLGDLDVATGVVTPITRYFTPPGAWTITDEFSLPARGQLGGVWEIDGGAGPPGDIFVSATGFRE